MLSVRRWAELFKKVRRRPFLIKLITMTALIAVIPNLASELTAYYKVSKTFEHETGSMKLQYLNQTIHAIDLILHRIKENSRQLALNRIFKDFESYPYGNYYEALQGELPKEDLPALYSYLETKTNVYLTMNAFKLSNAFVDSVYFYDSNKQLFMTSESDGTNRQFPANAFYDMDWIDSLDDTEMNPVILDPRLAKRYHGDEISILSVIYKSGKDDNAFIINLDASKLYNGIVNKLNDKDEMFIVSSTGSILFHSEQDVIYQSLDRVLPEGGNIAGGSGSYVEQQGNRQVLISYSTSPLLQWTFVNVTDLHALAKGTASIKQTMVISAVIILILTLTLAYLSSRSLYRPISRLSALMYGRWGHSEHADEIYSIGSFMESTIHERDYYKEKLEESLPFYREQFKYCLLHRHSFTLEEIEEKKKYLGLDIDAQGLIVMLLNWDDSGSCSPERDMINSDLYKIRIMDAIRASGLMTSKYFLVDAERDKIAIVLNHAGADQQYAFQLGQALLDHITSELETVFTIGVGRSCATLRELPRAYEEALEALKYQMICGKGDVISIEDMMIDSECEFRYPKEKEEQLIGHMKTAREAEAHHVFDEIVAEVVTHKNQLHYNQIQPIFVRLLTEFTTAFHQLGADLTAVCGMDADPYRELLDQDSIERIRSWFHELIRVATAYIEREMNVKGNQHITKVIEILEREYSQEISLHSVAEQLHLNPAYISRLFKQITGQSFVDYLKRIRIERSKELLSRGNLKVNEIGKQVGYDNAYYFIKVFKELIGLTPGEYKKIYGS